PGPPAADASGARARPAHLGRRMPARLPAALRMVNSRSRVDRVERIRRSTRPEARGRSRPRAPAPPPTPNQYLVLALRWWKVLAAGAVLGLVGALGYVRFGPILYTSTVQVMVPAPSDPSEDTIGSPRTV